MKRCSEIRICEVCKKEYNANVVTARFCSRKCMYDWRKNNNWEVVQCIGCGSNFTRRKNEKHHRTGLPKQYCSNTCSRSSKQKKEKLKLWANSNKNHWNDPTIQAKVKSTKKRKYGDENYNNGILNKKTCIARYGVPYVIVTSLSANGKRISKPQRRLFEQLQIEYPDIELERWLGDAEKSVDIFIPSQHKVIEVYGTYWHCDPRKYEPNFYNKSVHMTAQQIWNRDAARQKFLESLGYIVEIVWERDIYQ